MVIIESNGKKTSSSTVGKRTFENSEKIYVTNGGGVNNPKLNPATIYISSGGIVNSANVK